MAAAEHIPLETVYSSNLSAFGYNAEKQIAAVKFKSGEIFHYAGISPDLMARWYRAESLGGFYSREIRGKFPGEKMTGECPDCGGMGWIGETCEDCGCSVVVERPRKDGKAHAADSNLQSERSE